MRGPELQPTSEGAFSPLLPKLKLSLNVATCDRMKTELKARWEKTLRHKISGKDKLKILRIFLSQARREILSETPTR